MNKPTNFLTIQQTYPLAFADLFTWIRAGRSYIAGLDDRIWMTEEGYQLAHAQALDDRDLYDYFDSRQLIISINYEGTMFRASLHVDGQQVELGIGNHRRLVEQAAFWSAFGRQQERLTAAAAPAPAG